MIKTNMFDLLFPKAYAQTASITGAKTAETTQDIGGFAQYIFSNIDNWIIGVVIFIGSFILASFLSSIIREKIYKARGEDINENTLALVDKVTKVVVLTLGLTIALAINGINFTAVIGAFSLGMGFALKDILGNFISSIVMLAQNRIRIGDLIQIDNVLGNIVSIDTRVTVIQAIDGSEVVIPNQTMLNSTVTSYTTNPIRRIELHVYAGYRNNLEQVADIIKKTVASHEDVLAKPEVRVMIDEFEDYYVDFKIFFWIESGKKWMYIPSDIRSMINEQFVKLNVDNPWPTTTLKIDEDDRALLKTLDSIKKGFVPEPETDPLPEAIKKAEAEGDMADPYKAILEERHQPTTIKVESPVTPPPEHL